MQFESESESESTLRHAPGIARVRWRHTPSVCGTCKHSAAVTTGHNSIRCGSVPDIAAYVMGVPDMA
eukprot:1463515-Rhodomonas_salina.1